MSRVAVSIAGKWALVTAPVGLEEAADGVWSVDFCHVLLARIDERTGTLNRG
jgi:hypothetical protein